LPEASKVILKMSDAARITLHFMSYRSWSMELSVLKCRKMLKMTGKCTKSVLKLVRKNRVQKRLLIVTRASSGPKIVTALPMCKDCEIKPV